MGIITMDIDRVMSINEWDNLLSRITKCRRVRVIHYRWSASGNGYHIRVVCSLSDEEIQNNCDICRLVFDSDFRYMLDMCFRLKHQRNVLWKKKSYRKGDNRIQLEAGDWHDKIL